MSIHTISPATNTEILTTPEASWDDVVATVLPAAVAAQPKWFATPLAQRKAVLAEFANLLEAAAAIAPTGDGPDTPPDLALLMGRPSKYHAAELRTGAMRARTLIAFADSSLAPVAANHDNADTATLKFEYAAPGDKSGPQFKKYLTKEPLGTILIVFPWNYPYLTLINALVPALLAGNSVILKPSPQVPVVGTYVVDLLTKAGLPAGVAQVVQAGNPAIVSKLVKERSEIKGVAFIGSVEGGLSIQKAAAEGGRLIPINLELGGNDGAYVRADIGSKTSADLAKIADDIVDGALFNSGQSCCAIERVYVHESIWKEFVDATVAIVKGYKVGDPRSGEVGVGPVVSEASAQRVRGQVKEAVAAGGKLLVTDADFEYTRAEGASSGEPIPPAFVAPQVVAFEKAVPCTLLNDETFGPVLPLVKVSSDEEAVALINDDKYGLTASVWTFDAEKGEQLGSLLEAGTVFVNRADYPDPKLAWTGHKMSGRAVTLSRFGFDGFVKIKSHHVKKF